MARIRRSEWQANQELAAGRAPVSRKVSRRPRRSVLQFLHHLLTFDPPTTFVVLGLPPVFFLCLSILGAL